jgi:DNA-3-methyladenine glycosylase II
MFLKSKDKLLGEAIDRIGFIERPVITDLFEALINSIVGQQISMKAADTIWTRIKERFGEITAENIASVTIEEIQQCGMSTRKAGCIKGIAESVLSWDDLAIRRGVMMLYRHKELDKERFNRYKRRYSPYGTVASFYLWEVSLGR